MGDEQTATEPKQQATPGTTDADHSFQTEGMSRAARSLNGTSLISGLGYANRIAVLVVVVGRWWWWSGSGHRRCCSRRFEEKQVVRSWCLASLPLALRCRFQPRGSQLLTGGLFFFPSPR